MDDRDGEWARLIAQARAAIREGFCPHQHHPLEPDGWCLKCGLGWEATPRGYTGHGLRDWRTHDLQAVHQGMMVRPAGSSA